MKVLFITSNRLGDAVLSTGLIDYIVTTYPEARLTIACGSLPASLFEAVPGLERIITIDKKRFNGHWIKVWRQIIGTRWDMVVDLRDSAVSRLIRAREKHIYSNHINKLQHKVEQCASVMGLEAAPAPKLWFTPEQTAFADRVIPRNKKIIAVGPTANWIGKTWPAERFIETIDALSAKGQPLEAAHVAVFAAPGEEDAAIEVLEFFPEDYRIDMIAKALPGHAAAVISRCDLYIGNDSGLMHCAAAAGIPTLGLFGPSYPHLYHPWGDHCRYVRTAETFDQLRDFEGYDPKTLTHHLMESLRVDDVIKEAQKLIR